jgi:hypothetical protein
MENICYTFTKSLTISDDIAKEPICYDAYRPNPMHTVFNCSKNSNRWLPADWW